MIYFKLINWFAFIPRLKTARLRLRGLSRSQDRKVEDVKKLLSENTDPNNPKFSKAFNEIRELEGHSHTTVNFLAILERNGFKIISAY